MLSDIWIKRMMTFITSCCVLVTVVIFFGSCAGICEELSQAKIGPPNSWRDHHYEIHQQDLVKMDRVVELLGDVEGNIK